MTMKPGPGDQNPTVTFDSYVMSGEIAEPVAFDPEPRRAVTRATAPAFQVTPMMVAAGVIAVLTFMLGVLVTLQFTGPRAPQMAAAPVTGGVPVSDPGSLQDVVAASLEGDVTRGEAPDILAVSGNGQAQPQSTPDALEAAVIQGLLPERTVGKLTEAEKEQAVTEALSVISRNKLRMLREGVLVGVYTVEARKEGDSKRLVLKTINADLTSQTMANLLKDAARDGLINIPASLNTADGDLDMDTLIFNLVQTSLAADGTPEGAEAAREMSRRAFAASDAQTREVDGARVYTVEPGDSLAYISLQFYGQPSAHDRIFQANRNILSSPDKIQIGQRLIIPG